MKRWISGIIMAILVIAIVVVLPASIAQLIVVAISGLCFWEFLGMVFPKAPKRWLVSGLALVLSLAWLLIFSPQFQLFLLWCVVALWVGFALTMSRKTEFSERVAKLAYFYLGLFYAGFLPSFLGLLCGLPDWRYWIFLTLGATFMSDTGAYIAGHAIGKHKLAPQLSPGKTWEGFFGGILGAAFAGFVVSFLFDGPISMGHAILLAGILGIIGPFGDLSESLLKRGVGVKDSSHLIPGHGGILDRIDALIFTAPFVYFWITFYGG